METVKIAVPVIAMIVTVLMYIFKEKVTIKRAADKDGNKTDKKKKFDNYMAEGVAVGMCGGTAFAAMCGYEYMAIGMSLGMMFGMFAGLNIRK